MNSRPRVLIEDWLPVAELGIESRRERATPTPASFPPINQLHVWWARRPLVASAAVVLGGLLPAWSDHLAEAFRESTELQSETAYHAWLLRLVGIWGDPVAARKAVDAANAAGRQLAGNGYGYKQAYKNQPARADLDLLSRVLEHTWGKSPTLADTTAGGGSIPFVASRLGINTLANDLNPVAAAVLRGTVEIPVRFGAELTPHLKQWGKAIADQMQTALQAYFPLSEGETVSAYIWANAVRCPRTGRLVPLMPSKWLRKGKGKEVAVRLITKADDQDLAEPRFEILFGKDVDSRDADRGTVSRGNGVSPYDNLVIDGDYIKAEAQAGRMTQVLYAVAIKAANGTRTFRAATPADLDALEKSNRDLAAVRDEWEQQGILPTEEVPEGNKTAEARRYGFYSWADMYSARQLLVHGTFVKVFLDLVPAVREALPQPIADDVLTELALMQGKGLNYNSRLSFWHTPRQSMGNTFSKHDFAFLWTFAEFEGARALPKWCLEQTLTNYGRIVDLLQSPEELGRQDGRPDSQVVVTQGSAANLPTIADRSIEHLCIDPPYYDNVMYAELADFFYVWEKRTLGVVTPQFFGGGLTDKENEAVANPARFEAMGKRKKELATLDYEAKMTAIFSESQRILRDDGVLSVMFTHKRAEAWDTLGMSLLEAGFTIETSWPVNTEAQNSLHQANVNSAASTIMLVCRKRVSTSGESRVFLDDIEAEIRQAARDAATRFQNVGIEGVDLLLSTYGPTLSVISSHWPVYSSAPDESGRDRLLRPEEALDLAREEVVRLRRQRIVGKAAQIDGYTDFVLLAWDIFSAREFPFDTARLLALAVGGRDVDDLERAKIIAKKSGLVRLLTPRERLRRDADSVLPGVRPEAKSFDSMIDAVDTALYIGEVDGMAAAKVFMDKVGLTSDGRFHSTVQGLVNTIPRARVKGDWVVPEAGLLNTLVTAYLGEFVTLPADEAEPDMTEQGSLFDSAE
jgi:adenine-specific DNA methylase